MKVVVLLHISQALRVKADENGVHHLEARRALALLETPEHNHSVVEVFEHVFGFVKGHVQQQLGRTTRLVAKDVHQSHDFLFDGFLLLNADLEQVQTFLHQLEGFVGVLERSIVKLLNLVEDVLDGPNVRMLFGAICSQMQLLCRNLSVFLE